MSDGLEITNDNATTNVPVNYEICDRTGFRVRRGELILEWSGHLVREQSFEQRHMQDFIRSTGTEEIRGARSPEQDDSFIEDLFPNRVLPSDL